MNDEDIKIVKEPINRSVLKTIADSTFIEYTKAVVDIARNVLGLGGDMHADIERLLLEDGSVQQDLWGINLYPDRSIPEMIEFDSMINIRPRQNNRSRNVEDAGIRQHIIRVVAELIQ